jgi:Raf kinase inhibitor-like YbhB/YbcL family protein
MKLKFFMLVMLTLVMGLPGAMVQGRENSIDINLTSDAFKNSEMIPAQYTADGFNVSPPLAWSNIPDGTRTLAIICDDPDATGGTWVHWVIYNIPVKPRGLHEKIPQQKQMINGTRQGTNSSGNIGYDGPAPPSGTHRYFFKIYALDKALNLEAGCSKQQLLQAMEGHMIAKGQLVGQYSRP